MPIKRLSQTSLASFQKHSNLLAGNSAYSPFAFDLLETTLISGTTTSSITFSSLNTYSDYKHLQIRFIGRTSQAATNANVRFIFNGDTGSNYATHTIEGNGSAVQADNFTSQTSSWPVQVIGTSLADGWPSGVVDILDFANTNKNTTMRALTGWATATTSRIFIRSGLWNNTAAVTTINMSLASGAFLAGSRFSLYGVK